VVISNQPEIGLNRISEKIFKDIEKTIFQKIEKENAVIDKAYYCFHHPFAKIEEYRKNCECRKPKIDLFLQAAKDLAVDLKQSWMIGDGVSDIIAGHNAGCKTILVANIYESGYLKIFEEKFGDIKPDFMVKQVNEIIPIISSHS
jgi:histidinol-phosphate phosphatase family protein